MGQLLEHARRKAAERAGIASLQKGWFCHYCNRTFKSLRNLELKSCPKCHGYLNKVSC